MEILYGAYTHIHTHTCVYMFICMYTHTHTHSPELIFNIDVILGGIGWSVTMEKSPVPIIQR